MNLFSYEQIVLSFFFFENQSIRRNEKKKKGKQREMEREKKRLTDHHKKTNIFIPFIFILYYSLGILIYYFYLEISFESNDEEKMQLN